MVTAVSSTSNSSGYVSVQLGDGHGGFGASVKFTNFFRPNWVITGDVNGDRNEDLLISYFPVGGIRVLLGNGHGGFADAPDIPLGDNILSAALADFNSDGFDDLVYARGFAPRNTNTAFLLLNNGHGGFDPSINLIAGEIPYSIAVADFNSDGRADIATANMGSSGISVLLGNGSGGFASSINLEIAPGTITAGDFTNDGRADLLISHYGSPIVSVLPGNGTGGFGTPFTFTLGEGISSVAIADVNGDKRSDLITINTTSNTVSILLGGTNTYYADQDGDSFGDPGNSISACLPSPPAGYVLNKSDCDDHNAANVPTTITAQPVSLLVEEKQTATFSVNATGYNLTYQWYFQGSVPGKELKKETSPTLTIKHVKEGNGNSNDAGTYYVRVTGGCGSVLSKGAILTISSKKGRMGAEEPVSAFQVRVLRNPVAESVEVKVTGAENQPLQLSLTDVRGRIIGQKQTETAAASEPYRFDVSSQPAGILLLRVSSQGQSQTVRVLKAN
ncbi:hypothetical protein GCM10027085_13040 [Spirosoma aerophilum]